MAKNAVRCCGCERIGQRDGGAQVEAVGTAMSCAMTERASYHWHRHMAYEPAGGQGCGTSTGTTNDTDINSMNRVTETTVWRTMLLECVMCTLCVAAQTTWRAVTAVEGGQVLVSGTTSCVFRSAGCPSVCRSVVGCRSFWLGSYCTRCCCVDCCELVDTPTPLQLSTAGQPHSTEPTARPSQVSTPLALPFHLSHTSHHPSSCSLPLRSCCHPSLDQIAIPLIPIVLRCSAQLSSPHVDYLSQSSRPTLDRRATWDVSITRH